MLWAAIGFVLLGAIVYTLAFWSDRILELVRKDQQNDS